MFLPKYILDSVGFSNGAGSRGGVLTTAITTNIVITNCN